MPESVIPWLSRGAAVDANCFQRRTVINAIRTIAITSLPPGTACWVTACCAAQEDEFAGLSGSAGDNHDGQSAMAAAGAGTSFAETASPLALSVSADIAPQVLVQYCMS